MSENEVSILRGAAMRYFGQLHSIDVFLPGCRVGEPFGDRTLERLIQSFHERHEDMYGRSDPAMPVTIEEIKLHAVGKRRPFEMPSQPLGTEDPVQAFKRKRSVYFKVLDGFVETPCYDGERLVHGNVITGPSIIEETKTTVVIPPDCRVDVDGYGNFLMRRD